MFLQTLAKERADRQRQYEEMQRQMEELKKQGESSQQQGELIKQLQVCEDRLLSDCVQPLLNMMYLVATAAGGEGPAPIRKRTGSYRV